MKSSDIKKRWWMRVKWYPLATGVLVVLHAFTPKWISSDPWWDKCLFISITAVIVFLQSNLSYWIGWREAHVETLEKMNSFTAWTKVIVKERTGVDLDE